MAQTFDSRRLRNERDMDRRFRTQQRSLAQQIASLMLASATARNEGGDRIIPNQRRTREALRNSIWSRILKPYFIGPGDDPLPATGVTAQPQSPFARLLVDGITEAVRIQAQRQTALLRQTVRDETVLQWLTGPRPIESSLVTEQRGFYDPFHTFVDPNGYRLSDRIWQSSITTRSRIDAFLDYHISRGTGAVDAAELFEQFLTPGARQLRTRTPYGQEGSYAARRLLRTEIAAAGGRGTINSSIANPFVRGVRWVLSRSHSEPDECDENAHGGPDGDGVYPPDQVPAYPNHPHELCTLQPVAAGETADLVQALRRDIEERNPRAWAIRGMFNASWLANAILGGFLREAFAVLEGE